MTKTKLRTLPGIVDEDKLDLANWQKTVADMQKACNTIFSESAYFDLNEAELEQDKEKKIA